MSFKPRPSAVGSGAPLALVRELCRALPGVEETGSWGHPNFRAGRPARIFAALERPRSPRGSGQQPIERVCVKVGPEVRDALLAEGEPYAALPYDARGQWIGIDAARLDRDQLAFLLAGAYLAQAGGSPKRRTPARKPARRRRRPAG